MTFSVWKERWVWWVPALALLVLNGVAFGWFEVAYSGAAQNLDTRLERRAGEVETLTELVESQREIVARVRRVEARLAGFSDEGLSSSEERLTAVMREVRRLASTAGLEPKTISFPETDLEEYGLEKRNFNFSVSGTYMELRRFINLLEVSDFFLIVEDVSLSGRAEERELRINVRISTLFSTDPAAPSVVSEGAR